MEEYIEKCNTQKEAIISGLYEDDVKITSWYFLKEKNYQKEKVKIKEKKLRSFIWVITKIKRSFAQA